MDPSKDGPAIELSDRDPETAPPGGHSGDNNTATKSVTNVMEANENGNVDTGFRVSRLEDAKHGGKHHGQSC